MSLVNQMLQELDRRHAGERDPQTTAPGARLLERNVRATRQAAIGSEWFWRVLALLILFALGWVGWVVWQLAPRSNVTELAFKSAGRSRLSVQQPAPSPPVPPAAQQPESVPPAAAAATAASGSARPDMLALAREIRTPVAERPGRTAPAAAPVSDKPAASTPQPSSTDRTGASQSGPKPQPKALALSAPGAAAASSSGQIDKRDSNAPRDRAEAEFRRALAFVNQGRMAEGMEAFRAALNADPTYETARQTQVSLLLDARRVDEAANSLQEGLTLNPSNSVFAMLLARILVERNDAGGALALLQKHIGASAHNAEYHGFVAALYQRLGRHQEASDEYHSALRVAPQNGAWWIGLGISLEALQRGKEAAEAFRRARTAGPLTPELAGYVDQKLRALP